MVKKNQKGNMFEKIVFIKINHKPQRAIYRLNPYTLLLAAVQACTGLNSQHKGQVCMASTSQLFVHVITTRFCTRVG